MEGYMMKKTILYRTVKASVVVGLIAAGAGAVALSRLTSKPVSATRKTTKRAYVYTRSGKKTAKSYKKGTKLVARDKKEIKGKKYYNVGRRGKDEYVRSSDTKSAYKLTVQKKRLTRTIKFKLPKGKRAEVIKQTVTLKRRVKIDPKTKQKTYGKWTVGTWKAVRARKATGYQPSVTKIPALQVNSQTGNVTVVVTYQKKPRPGAEIRKHQRRVEKWRKYQGSLDN